LRSDTTVCFTSPLGARSGLVAGAHTSVVTRCA
jgi:hypothetical protein